MSEREPKEAAELAVAGIIDNLNRRSALRQAWDMIDEDIQEEITAAWVQIVIDVITLPEPQP